LFGGVALVAVGGVAAAGLALLGTAAVLVPRILQPYLGRHDRRLRRLGRLAGWLLPVGFFALAGLLAMRLGGHTAALPQLAALGSTVTLWLSVVLARGGPGQRWLKR
ncbi:hypothetical protein, partial [Couchioplanes caeruleus]